MYQWPLQQPSCEEKGDQGSYDETGATLRELHVKGHVSLANTYVSVLWSVTEWYCSSDVHLR